MSKRLVSVTQEIKDHPLWKGSMEELAFLYGGVTVDQIERMIGERSRCDDLTPREKSWIELWKKQLK